MQLCRFDSGGGTKIHQSTGPLEAKALLQPSLTAQAICQMLLPPFTKTDLSIIITTFAPLERQAQVSKGEGFYSKLWRRVIIFQ